MNAANRRFDQPRSKAAADGRLDFGTTALGPAEHELFRPDGPSDVDRAAGTRESAIFARIGAELVQDHRYLRHGVGIEMDIGA